MLIKEGSTIKLLDYSDLDRPVYEQITAQEDINFNSQGYTFLLAHRGGTLNAIFESEEVEQINESEFVIKGYFKDAILILTDREESSMYESCMNFD